MSTRRSHVLPLAAALVLASGCASDPDPASDSAADASRSIVAGQPQNAAGTGLVGGYDFTDPAVRERALAIAAAIDVQGATATPLSDLPAADRDLYFASLGELSLWTATVEETSRGYGIELCGHVELDGCELPAKTYTIPLDQGFLTQDIVPERATRATRSTLPQTSELLPAGADVEGNWKGTGDATLGGTPLTVVWSKMRNNNDDPNGCRRVAHSVVYSQGSTKYYRYGQDVEWCWQGTNSPTYLYNFSFKTIMQPNWEYKGETQKDNNPPDSGYRVRREGHFYLNAECCGSSINRNQYPDLETTIYPGGSFIFMGNSG